MISRQVVKHERTPRNRVNVAELYLNGNTGFAMAEFYRLLSDSQFVAKVMLVATAADRWRLTPDRCRTANSVVYGPGNQSARYAELAHDAARRPVPDKVSLKNPSEL